MRFQPRNIGLILLITVTTGLLPQCATAAEHSKQESPKPKIAAIVTEYRHNSHADMFVTRLLKTYTLDGKGERPGLELASLYTDQVPNRDTSRNWAKTYGFPIYDTVADAMTLGTGTLAVDGVLLIAEHGNYPRSETGQKIYPKRRLFSEIVKVFEKSGRVVPVFSDKHLADNWKDAKWFYDTAKRLKIPLMAGSSLPTTWRYPPVDVLQGARLKQLVAFSYGSLDAYGFHGLEMVQCLIERRRGGETGVASVQCLVDDAVWKAQKNGVYDPKLFRAALSRLKKQPVPQDSNLQQLVKHPVLFVIDYRDGLRVNLFTLNGAVGEFASAWRYEDGKIDSTLFFLQSARPYNHFTHLLKGIGRMMHAGRPTWPADRTLLTSGTLDALLISKRRGGKSLNTPYLNVTYTTNWIWTQPPAPPPDRPSKSQ